MMRKALSGILILFLLLVAAVSIFLSGGPELPADADDIIAQEIDNEPPILVTGNTGYAQSGSINIWYEVIKPAGKPGATVLLVMGAGTSSMLWPSDFIQSMVKNGYQVIRFDNRGTGMSDWVEGWSSNDPYSLEDMANDALAVLDASGVRRAHVVGTSLGGMIGQRLAISHGDRVLSLVSMSTSAYVFDPEFAKLRKNFGLEAMRLVFKYAITGSETGMIKMMAGFIDLMLPESLSNEDIRSIARLALYEMRSRRGFNYYAQGQHFAAMKKSGSRLQELGFVKCPVLVVHGTRDEAIDIAHARKYAGLIPGAKTLWLQGAGHIIRDEHMPAMMEAIFRQFASTR